MLPTVRAPRCGPVVHSESSLNFRPPGGIPERSKGTGCKPVGSAFEGSNPSPTITPRRRSPANMPGHSREDLPLTADTAGHRKTAKSEQLNSGSGELRGGESHSTCWAHHGPATWAPSECSRGSTGYSLSAPASKDASSTSGDRGDAARDARSDCGSFGGSHGRWAPASTFSRFRPRRRRRRAVRPPPRPAALGHPVGRERTRPAPWRPGRRLVSSLREVAASPAQGHRSCLPPLRPSSGRSRQASTR
jgi:hypothetical protein